MIDKQNKKDDSFWQEVLDDAAKKRRSERFGTASDSTVSDDLID